MMSADFGKQERVAMTCVCCGNADLSSAPAVLMPFVAHRALGWPPVSIDESWGLDTIRKGFAYTVCRSLYCSRCCFLFLDIRFSNREMSNLYGGYREEEYVHLRESYEPGYRLRNEQLKKRAGYLTQVDKFIESHLVCDRPRVLDWGGGTGCNSPLASLRSQLDIYDISGDAPVGGARAISLGQARQGDYDVISCCQVLEHVPYPADVLGEILPCMSGDTLLYVDVPFESVMRHPETCLSKKHHWHEHINFYSISSMRELFHSVGLNLINSGIVTGKTEGAELSILGFIAKKR